MATSNPNDVITGTSSPKPGFRRSTLLTKEENERVRAMLGEGCQGLVTSVIQLFTTTPPEHNEWTKKDAGILVLVRDSIKRSYFLRLYCLKRKSQLWEMELYRNMEYDAPKPFLHVFEGQDRVFALNFASEAEAQHTYNIINSKLEKSKQKYAKLTEDGAGPSTSPDGQQEAAAAEVLETAEAEKEEAATSSDADTAGTEESSAVTAASEKTDSSDATGAASEQANNIIDSSAETPQDELITSEVTVILPAPSGAADEQTGGEPASDYQLGEENTPEEDTEQQSSLSSVPKYVEDVESTPDEEEEGEEKGSPTPAMNQHSATLNVRPEDDRQSFQGEDMTALLAKARADREEREKAMEGEAATERDES